MTKHSLRSTEEVIQNVEVKQFFVFNLQKKNKVWTPRHPSVTSWRGLFFYRLYFTDIRAIVRFEIKIFWDPHGGGQLGMDPTSKQIEILSNGRQRLRASSSSSGLEPFFHNLTVPPMWKLFMKLSISVLIFFGIDFLDWGSLCKTWWKGTNELFLPHFCIFSTVH